MSRGQRKDTHRAPKIGATASGVTFYGDEQMCKGTTSDPVLDGNTATRPKWQQELNALLIWESELSSISPHAQTV